MLSPPYEERNSHFGRYAATRTDGVMTDQTDSGATRQTKARAARKGLPPNKKIEEIAEN